jgi:hypothetical protein
MPMPKPQHIETFFSNGQEIFRLIAIHEILVGAGPGRKAGVEVLHKSAIVLLVACWEAFIEDLASAAFDFALNNAKSYSTFPPRVLIAASKTLKADPDERAIWQLAGGGWITVMKSHKDRILKRYIYRFSSPSPDNIDSLFEQLLGISSVSSHWHWPRMSSESARKNLERLINLRGSIAHRVAASRKIYKQTVKDYSSFVNHLALVTHNRVTEHLVLLQLNDYTVIFPPSTTGGGKQCPNLQFVGSNLRSGEF